MFHRNYRTWQNGWNLFKTSLKKYDDFLKILKKKGHIIGTRNSLSLSLSLSFFVSLTHSFGTPTKKEKKKEADCVGQMNCICVVLIDLLPCQIFQVRITRTYLSQQFHDDLKLLYQAAGIGENKQQVVFLFDDTQVVEETFLEDINNILSTGEVGCWSTTPPFSTTYLQLSSLNLLTPLVLLKCSWEKGKKKEKKWSLNSQEIHHLNWCFGGDLEVSE